MTDIVRTASQAGLVFPQWAEVYDVILAETVVALQPAYQLTSGKFGLADANAAGKQQARGIFLTGGGANQAATLLKRGHVYGYTVSALNADVQLFLSDNVGEIADAAGTMSVVIGRVVALSNLPTLTKVTYIDADWLRQWS